MPDTGGQPIAEIGLAISSTGKRADGRLLVDYISWDGTPELTLKRPAGDGDFWRMSWVNGANFFSKRFPPSFRISQNTGEGIIIHGTRQWTDYQVCGDVMMHLGNYGGVAIRAQGLRRYYGARVTRDGKMQIVRVRDENTAVLAETAFNDRIREIDNDESGGQGRPDHLRGRRHIASCGRQQPGGFSRRRHRAAGA